MVVNLPLFDPGSPGTHHIPAWGAKDVTLLALTGDAGAREPRTAHQWRHFHVSVMLRLLVDRVGPSNPIF